MTHTSRPLTMPDRHPYEIYLTAAILAGSLPAALGFVEPPASVRHQLSHSEARFWSITLCFGAACVLIGVLWPRPRKPNMMSVTGLLIEQVGLVILAVGSFFYGPAAFIYGGAASLIPAVFIAGFGFASASLAFRIWRILQARS